MDWSNFTIGFIVGGITAAVHFWWFRKALIGVVEPRGIEPLTFAMPLRRSPS
jgi:hypothetical protein